MRSTIFAPGEFYHVCNRSHDRKAIFLDQKDYARFLFLLLYFQSPTSFTNISRIVSYFVQHRVFNIEEKIFDEVLKGRFVKLLGFTIMPNHFHVALQEIRDGGTSRYMQKVLNAYGKYFNTKYKKTGHIFTGPFRAVHVESNEQLLHLSCYIHKNVSELSEWKKRESKYPWSSYQDFTEENRWGELLVTAPVSDQFKSNAEYSEFLRTSTAKEEYMFEPA